MSDDPKLYRVRNTIVRLAAVSLTICSLLPFALLGLGVMSEGAVVTLIGATLWVNGSVLLGYMAVRGVETGMPIIWRREV